MNLLFLKRTLTESVASSISGAASPASLVCSTILAIPRPNSPRLGGPSSATGSPRLRMTMRSPVAAVSGWLRSEWRYIYESISDTNSKPTP